MNLSWTITLTNLPGNEERFALEVTNKTMWVKLRQFLGKSPPFFTIKSCLMVSLGWPINRSYGESQLTHQTQTSRAILFGLFGLSARIKKKIAGVCRGFSWWMIFHGGAGKWLHSLPLSDDDDKKNICQCE